MPKRLPVMGRMLVLLVACAGAAGTGRAPDDNRPAPFRVIAYLPEWRLERSNDERFRLVDELIYFSIEPTAEGGVDARRFTPRHRELLSEIRKAYGTRVRVAIGGWHRSGAFAAMATDAARRARFVAALTQFCRDNAFAGADFDWEFPKGGQEVEAYADLLADTKAAFAPHGLSLSVAVNRTQRIPRRGIDAVDAVHVMAYDDGERHATPERAAEAIDSWLAQGVPPEKLVLGLPFYGRKVEDARKSMGYSEIVKKHQPAPDADEAGGFYFNGPGTIELKTRSARERRLAGVMIWEIAGDVDPTDPASLLQAIRRVEREAK